MVRNNGTATSLSEFGEGVTRRQIGSLSINIICMLMIFVLCYLCLVIVLVRFQKKIMNYVFLGLLWHNSKND